MRFKEKLHSIQVKIGGMLLLTGIVSLIVFITDNARPLPITKDGVNYIERNGHGEGERNEELQVWIGDKKESYTVRVDEQKYTKEELEKAFEDAEVQIEKLVLGENKSLDDIRSDLNLITSIPETGIQVSWEMDNYEVLDMQGRIQTDKVKEETVVMLKALLHYENEKEEYDFHIRIIPVEQSQQETKLSKLDERIMEADEESKSRKQMLLPLSLEGETLVWRYAENFRAFGIFVIGIAGVVFVYVSGHQKEKEKKTEREKQLELDYPQLISRFTLFLGAGMTPRNVWSRIVNDYERAKRVEAGTEEHAVYEEMAYTMHEMKGGLSERECYERFGKRCGLQVYRKFGTMLSQNLKKGTSGLSELLRQEADNAFEERKNTAKRLGEEAGTKMLIPMFLMLAVVLTIIVVPAFLSMQI